MREELDVILEWAAFCVGAGTMIVLGGVAMFVVGIVLSALFSLAGIN